MASTQSDKSETDEETPSEEAAADEAAEEESEGTESADESDEESDEESESEDDSGSEDDSDSADGADSEDEASSDDDASADDAEASDSSDSERAAGGAASPSTTGKGKKDKARANKKDGLTAGARLAAAKAAKAARKAAKRGKEKKEADPIAQVRDSQLAKKAQRAGSWAAENRNTVIAALVVALLGVGGWLGWSSYTDEQAQAAGALLADAVEIAQAEIVTEEEPGEDATGGDEPEAEEPDADAPPTFPTEEARAEAALEAYRRVLTQYPSSDAAVWARLGEARALSDLGRQAEAREAYEAAESEGGSDPSVALRALEGIAFTFEAEEQWDQALQAYERLAAVDGQRYQPVAEYHRARMYIAKGERERATETLRGLVEDLGEAEEDPERQDFAYVLAQAETRLRELDPSAAPPPRANESPLGGLGGGPGGQMTPEQIQELIRQFQQKQQREQQGGGAE